MIQIHRSALLPYSAQQLFELVDDIAAYPQYLEGCEQATVLLRDEKSVTARLQLRKGGISVAFTTRNQLDKPRHIHLQLVEGPFEQLQGEWQFASLAADACKVSLDLRFQLQHRLTHRPAEKLIESVAGNLVNAVCQRARKIYG